MSKDRRCLDAHVSAILLKNFTRLLTPYGNSRQNIIAAFSCRKISLTKNNYLAESTQVFTPQRYLPATVTGYVTDTNMKGTKRKIENIILHILNVLSFYQLIPYYKLKSLFIFLTFFLPFVPSYWILKSKSYVILILYCTIYSITTLLILAFLLNRGRKISVKTFQNLSTEKSIFIFVGIQILYSLTFFTIISNT